MLDTQHFYFNGTRKVIVAFGTLFNNLHISREDDESTTKDESRDYKVPIIFASFKKHIEILRNKAKGERINLILPRMSFEITNIQYDPSREKDPLRENRVWKDENTVMRQRKPAPYNYSISLHIISKYKNDTFQIIEQILPFFRPDFTVTVIDKPLGLKTDLPFKFDGIGYNDEFEGLVADDKKYIRTELQFTAEGFLYPPVKESGVIKRAIVTVRPYIADEVYPRIEDISTYMKVGRTGIATQDEVGTLVGEIYDYGESYRPYEKYTQEVSPFEAGFSDPHTIIESFEFVE